MSVLVTGGLGFIGSHTCVELLNCGRDIIVVDNLSNSKIEVLNSIKKINNQDKIKFYEMDLLNKSDLEDIFKLHKINSVIHFAGLKAVAESVKYPMLYYSHNLTILFNLIEAMEKYGCYNLIFSSSATVYGNCVSPCKETDLIGVGITNPYGQTKYMQECILHDLCKSNSKWNVTILRYFNPVGAHESGLLFEDPLGIPNNLMPVIIRCVTNNTQLTVFGNDYDTRDGTCIRDFIHVVDLAKGHISALQNEKGLRIFNLGTGNGTSVLELINTFEKVNNVKINYKFGERRDGDLMVSYANVDKAKEVLGWKAEKGIADMCRDAYLKKIDRIIPY